MTKGDKKRKEVGSIGRELVQNEKGGREKMKKEPQKKKKEKRESTEQEQRRGRRAKAQNPINDWVLSRE